MCTIMEGEKLFPLHKVASNAICSTGIYRTGIYKDMKSFIAKRVKSIFVNLRLKLLKYKENNKIICDTFDHNSYTFTYELASARYDSKGINLYYRMVPLL